MNILVLVSETFKNMSDVEQAVKTVNGLGTAFKLSAVGLPSLTHVDNKTWIRPPEIVEKIRNTYEKIVPTFVIVENRLKEDMFSVYKPSLYIFTTTDWKKYSPSLTTYLIYMFACGLPSVACGLPERSSDSLDNHPDIGCISDYCGDKSNIMYSMMIGDICPHCRDLFANNGLEAHYLDSTEKLLNYVKKEMIPYRQRIKQIAPAERVNDFETTGRSNLV